MPLLAELAEAPQAISPNTTSGAARARACCTMPTAGMPLDEVFASSCGGATTGGVPPASLIASPTVLGAGEGAVAPAWDMGQEKAS